MHGDGGQARHDHVDLEVLAAEDDRRPLVVVMVALDHERPIAHARPHLSDGVPVAADHDARVVADPDVDIGRALDVEMLERGDRAL